MPEHYALDEFRSRRFGYRPGQQVSFIGPTQQAGKTTLAFALLDAVASNEVPATVLVMKEADRVVAGLGRRLGLDETPTWPPRRRLSNWHPRGHLLWPHQTLTDEDRDNKLLESQFRAAIYHHRKHPPGIIFADELYGLLAELNLRRLLTAVVTRSSGNRVGMWYANQKPSGTQGVSIPGYFFNSPTWTFLSKDGDERNRARYGEIGCGISPRAIDAEVQKLAPYSWLCINRDGPAWCVVDAYDPAWHIPVN